MRPRLVTLLVAVSLVAVSVTAAQPPQGKAKDKAKAPPEPYTPHADTQPQAGLPKGKLLQQPEWKSQVLKDTVRNWWVYVPEQYKPDGPPACVMVFQDGEFYIKPPVNVPVVFDNLIHRGEMPVTVGVFISPGDILRPDGTRQARGNRSFEYDTLSDQYARFLLEEMLPATEKQAGVKLSANPAHRAIGGRSSGGICAWTVAWEKPDQFGKVWSAIGSFTNIRGGDRYPGMIRKTPKKPIRICFQDGENDLDNNNGNWWLGNLQMEKALAFMRYDYKFIPGVGGHTPPHEAAVLPDALRWLWRDHKAAQ
jgi:enterochelin esterase family protein